MRKPADHFEFSFLHSKKLIKNEIEDDDMAQDTPHSDRSDDDESESVSGTGKEDSSGKSPYY